VPAVANINEPTLQQFPKAIEALRSHATVAVLEPGDTLWLPAFWFHHVTALDTSVSLSIYYSSATKMHGQKLFQIVTEHQTVMELLQSHDAVREYLLWYIIAGIFYGAVEQPVQRLVDIANSRFEKLSTDALLRDAAQFTHGMVCLQSMAPRIATDAQVAIACRSVARVPSAATDLLLDHA
jgi:hypothetical protein